MKPVTATTSRLRGSALFAAGALLVHQLRYLVGYGPGAENALVAHGHAYLVVLEPAVGVLVALAGGRLFLAVLAGGGRTRTRVPSSFRARWLATSLAILACYVVQELVEGVLFSFNHPGFATLWEAGGLSAMVAAVLVGALVTLLLRGAEVAEDSASAGPLRYRALAMTLVASPGLRTGFLMRLHPLAGHLAGRAPPKHSH